MGLRARLALLTAFSEAARASTVPASPTSPGGEAGFSPGLCEVQA